MRRGRRRKGRRGRKPTPVYIGYETEAEKFEPIPPTELQEIIIEEAELEALRLVDLNNLSQEEAGEKMGVSRGTIWRLLKRARSKLVKALTEGRRIRIRRFEEG